MQRSSNLPCRLRKPSVVDRAATRCVPSLKVSSTLIHCMHFGMHPKLVESTARSRRCPGENLNRRSRGSRGTASPPPPCNRNRPTLAIVSSKQCMRISCHLVPMKSSRICVQVATVASDLHVRTLKSRKMSAYQHVERCWPCGRGLGAGEAIPAYTLADKCYRPSVSKVRHTHIPSGGHSDS